MANSAREININAGDQFCKAFLDFTGTGTVTINDSFNVASISDNGTGDYSVNWDVDFASSAYCVPMAVQGNGVDNVIINHDFSNAKTSGSIRVKTRVEDGAATDALSVYLLAYGAQ